MMNAIFQYVVWTDNIFKLTLHISKLIFVLVILFLEALLLKMRKSYYVEKETLLSPFSFEQITHC